METQLIYHSMASDGLNETDLQQILEEARSNNPTIGVTGCLLFYEDEFLQVLEGERNAVDALFDQIRKDERHNRVALINQQDANRRLYSDWSMTFKNFDDSHISELSGAIDMTSFHRLHDLKSSPDRARSLFAHISRHIISDRPTRLFRDSES